MKKLFSKVLLLAAIFTSCSDNNGEVRTTRVKRHNRTTKKSNLKKDTIKEQVQNIVAQQHSVSFFSNNFKDCKYPDLIRRVLETKLQYEMEVSKKPREYYSDWFYQIHIAEKTDSSIINFIDNAIDGTIKYLAKNMQLNYDALSGQDTTAKVFMKK